MADAEVVQESPVVQGSSVEENVMEVRDIGNTYVVDRCIMCVIDGTRIRDRANMFIGCH